MNFILKWNAEPDLKDHSGRTPLSYAAQRGSDDTVPILLEKGAEPNTGDNAGRLPLSYAAQRSRKDIARHLIVKGAKLESKDKRRGWTPLSWAAISGQGDVVDFFLPEGAALNSEDNRGRTVVSHAARYGHEAVAQLRFEKEAKPGSKRPTCIKRKPLLKDRSVRFCDICSLMIPKGVSYHHCRVCYSGNFDICSICFEDDPRCLDESHELEREINSV